MKPKPSPLEEGAGSYQSTWVSQCGSLGLELPVAVIAVSE